MPPYTKGIDLAEFEEFARDEWDKAVQKVGGHCNEHGFDFKPNTIGDYLAKHDLSHALANKNTKNGRKKGSTLGQLLDKAARGDIAKKLGIPTCTDWKDEERQIEIFEQNINKPEPITIRYPIHDHLKATAIDHPRFGLALILRAARGW